MAKSKSNASSDAPTFRPERIVSGGQTGVDRAALDVAIELGIDHGGWCPRGRLAEDGTIHQKYQLVEMAGSKYPPRTRQNIVDSDATLVLYRKPVGSGTALTMRLCQSVGRPSLCVDLSDPDRNTKIIDWLSTCQPKILNVAGPRESQNEGVYEQVKALLGQVWN